MNSIYISPQRGGFSCATTGPGFEHLYMIIEAARAGIGLALLPRQLRGRALDEKALEVIVPTVSPSAGSTYRFYLDLREHDPIVSAFRDWVLEGLDSSP